SSRRRHTRFSRGWSSDVCSSDLALLAACVFTIASGVGAKETCSAEVGTVEAADGSTMLPCDLVGGLSSIAALGSVVIVIVSFAEIGRASCRERVQVWAVDVVCGE